MSAGVRHQKYEEELALERLPKILQIVYQEWESEKINHQKDSRRVDAEGLPDRYPGRI